MIDLLKLAKTASQPKSRDRAELIAWLRSCGWHYNEEYRGWMHPDSRTDSSLGEACRRNAEALMGSALRARGWLCPHRIGVCCFGSPCRAPGTFDEHGCSIRGSGGRWLNLRQAYRQEFGVAPLPDSEVAP